MHNEWKFDCRLNSRFDCGEEMKCRARFAQLLRAERAWVDHEVFFFVILVV